MKTKILIGVITCDFKDYAWTDFEKQLNFLKGQGHDVFIVDNSIQMRNRKGFDTYHYRNTKVIMERTRAYNEDNKTKDNGIVLVTRDCMNILREHFLEGDYTHLFILESDVFINHETVQRLLDMDADVTNFTYKMKLARNKGELSLCVQLTDNNNASVMATPEESKEILNTGIKILNFDVVNGKKITHCGYGCTMVKRRVLEKIKFKAVRIKGITPFPDSVFHLDVNNAKFTNKLDTDWLPEHRNLQDETMQMRKLIEFQRTSTRAQRRKAVRKSK